MALLRVNINGDYLIIAPKGAPAFGYYHSLTERAFLVDNLENFIREHPKIDRHLITIYELKEVNEESNHNESRPTL